MQLKSTFLIALEHIFKIYLPPPLLEVIHSLYALSDKPTFSETSEGHWEQALTFYFKTVEVKDKNRKVSIDLIQKYW